MSVCSTQMSTSFSRSREPPQGTVSEPLIWKRQRVIAERLKNAVRGCKLDIEAMGAAALVVLIVGATYLKVPDRVSKTGST